MALENKYIVIFFIMKREEELKTAIVVHVFFYILMFQFDFVIMFLFDFDHLKGGCLNLYVGQKPT